MFDVRPQLRHLHSSSFSKTVCCLLLISLAHDLWRYLLHDVHCIGVSTALNVAKGPGSFPFSSMLEYLAEELGWIAASAD